MFCNVPCIPNRCKLHVLILSFFLLFFDLRILCIEILHVSQRIYLWGTNRTFLLVMNHDFTFCSPFIVTASAIKKINRKNISKMYTIKIYFFNEFVNKQINSTCLLFDGLYSSFERCYVQNRNAPDIFMLQK